MTNYRFSVVIERDENGYYAYCPELQGCYTQGDTYEEALANIKDAKVVEYKKVLSLSELLTSQQQYKINLDRKTLHDLTTPQLMYIWSNQ